MGVIFLIVPLLLVPFLGRGFLSTYCVTVLEDAGLEYNISPCDDCGLLFQHWDDGIINVSLGDHCLMFDQTLIYWCDFNPRNFSMELHQVGSNLTIIAQYADDGLVTDCLCPVKISGIITPLEIANYTLTFKLEITVYDLFRFTLPNGTTSEPTGEPISFRSSTLAIIAIEIPSTTTLSTTIYPSNPSTVTTSTNTSIPTSSDDKPFSSGFEFFPLFLVLTLVSLVICRKRSFKCETSIIGNGVQQKSKAKLFCTKR
jgi:hypothetical protein